MSIAALVRGMAAAGAPAEAIALAVEAVEAEQNKLTEKRAQAAARKRAQRERDCRVTVTGQGEDRDATGSLDKGFPATPSKTQTSEAPLTPQPRAKKQKIPIPPEWAPPPIAELSEKAREYASRWPAGRYEAEAEAFVAFWLNDGRCRPDWRLTWITRIINVHSQVMRDARFAPPPPTNGHRPPMTAADLRRGIQRAEDFDDPERAAELRKQLAELLEHPPDPKVAHIVTAAAKSMSVRH